MVEQTGENYEIVINITKILHTISETSRQILDDVLTSDFVTPIGNGLNKVKYDVLTSEPVTRSLDGIETFVGDGEVLRSLVPLNNFEVFVLISFLFIVQLQSASHKTIIEDSKRIKDMAKTAAVQGKIIDNLAAAAQHQQIAEEHKKTAQKLGG